MNLKKKQIEQILININPKIKSYVNDKRINLTRDGLLDSLMIIRLIAECEKITKKRIKVSKIDKKTFSNINSIYKFFN